MTEQWWWLEVRPWDTALPPYAVVVIGATIEQAIEHAARAHLITAGQNAAVQGMPLPAPVVDERRWTYRRLSVAECAAIKDPIWETAP